MKTGQKKVVVIEDDRGLLKNIKEILEEENYLVRTATDGEEGIRVVMEWLPDIVICDIAMPVKDGYEVLKEISKHESTKRIPFIFLTAKVDKDDLRKGMSLGADDYIFKPFEINDLLNSLKIRLQKADILSDTKDDNAHQKSYSVDNKIFIKCGSKTHSFFIKELKYLKAESPYILLKFSDGRHTLQRQTLDEWQVKLPQNIFIRIHRSTIVNTAYINRIEKLGVSSYAIRLSGEEEPFVVSKRFYSKVRRHLREK
ncbi:MAG: response regulator [Ignavibacterium album]|uniref:LytR/AlgR family response regulator transcription factor n=1 Tax=Ignavibacterium album TaxID=591197 RepID=UPI0026EBD604|nr:response regulator [Ignavibacterium album]MCX8104651.1 response regulator [Ignavibacterium album]